VPNDFNKDKIVMHESPVRKALIKVAGFFSSNLKNLIKYDAEHSFALKCYKVGKTKVITPCSFINIDKFSKSGLINKSAHEIIMSKLISYSKNVVAREAMCFASGLLAKSKHDFLNTVMKGMLIGEALYETGSIRVFNSRYYETIKEVDINKIVIAYQHAIMTKSIMGMINGARNGDILDVIKHFSLCSLEIIVNTVKEKAPDLTSYKTFFNKLEYKKSLEYAIERIKLISTAPEYCTLDGKVLTAKKSYSGNTYGYDSVCKLIQAYLDKFEIKSKEYGKIYEDFNDKWNLFLNVKSFFEANVEIMLKGEANICTGAKNMEKGKFLTILEVLLKSVAEVEEVNGEIADLGKGLKVLILICEKTVNYKEEIKTLETYKTDFIDKLSLGGICDFISDGLENFIDILEEVVCLDCNIDFLDYDIFNLKKRFPNWNVMISATKNLGSTNMGKVKDEFRAACGNAVKSVVNEMSSDFSSKILDLTTKLTGFLSHGDLGKITLSDGMIKEFKPRAVEKLMKTDREKINLIYAEQFDYYRGEENDLDLDSVYDKKNKKLIW